VNQAAPGETVGMISYIIPAYNEEALIGATLRALNAAAREVGEPFEVLVVDDHSTDRTAAIAEVHGARVLRVQNRQIAATRNAGARQARGEVFFFIDADTLANAGAIRAACTALRKGAVGGGCVFRYDGPLPLWGRILYPIGIRAGRLFKMVGGCFLFCTRGAFQAAGGFCEEYYAAEELAFIKALKRQGRFVVPREMVVTSVRKVADIGFWKLMWLLLRIALRGPDAFRRREGLELWYGERKPQ
jgi:glycosyltransferase involved in cell wall biosynthesis